MVEDQVLLDDGLQKDEVGPWAERKYGPVDFYRSLFCRSIRSKWDELVYIDLYASSGFALIKESKRILFTSALRALALGNGFDKYIFCEQDVQKIDSLRIRVDRLFPELSSRVQCIVGDANANSQRILEAIPRGTTSHTVLTLCFADPYGCSNLHFSTIKTLSKVYVDFLVLIPTGMQINRFISLYSSRDSAPLDDFLGNPEWRQRWVKAKSQGISPECFSVKEFGDSMSRLGYIPPELCYPVRSDAKNLALYHLALYSRHELGNAFWKQAHRYGNPQGELFS